MGLRQLAQNARSATRARRRMELTGLTPNGHLLWAEWEAGNLIGGYPDYNSVMALNVRRTRPAHHGKAARLQITRPRAPEWQPQEIATVRRMFGGESREAMMAAVSRSLMGINLPAGVVHGVAAPAQAMSPERGRPC